MTFSAAAVRNPGAVTRMVYVPAGKYGSVYVPVPVVVALVSTPVALLVATTVAPGTEAPAGSVTVPFSVPTGPCATAREPKHKIIAQDTIRMRSIR
jgi:hypothetical protein